jgi:5-methylcytosine-specific restriction endonuclease McrA
MTIIILLIAFAMFVLIVRNTNKPKTIRKVTVKGKLIPDLIVLPYQNVRTRLKPAQWQKIREIVLKRTNCVCEVCNCQYDESLHVHEKWLVDRTTGTQSLIGLMGLCPDCHSVFHILNSISRGVGERAIAHMLRVNGWTQSQGQRAIAESRAIVKGMRNQYWLDLQYLNQKEFDFLLDENKKRIIFNNKENRNCINTKEIF